MASLRERRETGLDEGGQVTVQDHGVVAVGVDLGCGIDAFVGDIDGEARPIGSTPSTQSSSQVQPASGVKV